MTHSFILLFSILSSAVAGEQFVEVKNFINEDSQISCLEVCEMNGYECYDNVVQAIECAQAGMEVCGLSSIKDATHYYQCDKGGCYVDCNSGYYADRGEKYLTCYSQPICHSSDPEGTSSFAQICPCAVITSTPPKALHIYLWEIIGMFSLTMFFVVGGIATVYHFYPELFPTRENMAPSVGMGKDSSSISLRISKYFTEASDSIAGHITTISSTVSSSYVGLSDTFASGASEESRRRRKERRSAHQETPVQAVYAEDDEEVYA